MISQLNLFPLKSLNHGFKQHRDEQYVKRSLMIFYRFQPGYELPSWVSTASASARAAARSASFTLACESNTDIDGSIHTWMSGAFSPSCARIQMQYRLGRGTEFLLLKMKSNMMPPLKPHVSSQGFSASPGKTIFQEGISSAASRISARSVFLRRERAEACLTAAYAMLARGGDPGGSNYPEVPVLELEYSCVSNSF
jgi:hypothetical protein